MRTLKTWLIFFCLSLPLFADASLPFKETRYIYAIDKTLILEGFITFTEHNIIIEYLKPEPKVLTYFEEQLSIQDQNGYQMIDIQKNPMLSYFFMIIKAIHENNTVLIDSFFEQHKEGNTLKLIPKDTVANVLEDVQVVYQKNALKSLHVKVKNGDRIGIEIME